MAAKRAVRSSEDIILFFFSLILQPFLNDVPFCIPPGEYNTSEMQNGIRENHTTVLKVLLPVSRLT